MSEKEKPEAPMYVYESTVHCANILLCLDDQRKQDILCDVTVLVEGREIRAHRAVLAACSQYFLQVLMGQTEQEQVISLPARVTARGFAPLLQFAYTAKLLLSRENIQEVMCCAEFLGMHNLEDSCFRFLQAQLNSEGDGVLLCQKLPSSQDQDHSEDESVPSETPKITSSRARAQPDALGPSRLWEGERLPLPISTSLSYTQADKHVTSDLPRCPKYRKYQQACTEHNNTSSHSSTSSLPSSLQETITSGGSHSLALSQAKGEESLPVGLSAAKQESPERAGGMEMEMEMELELDGGPRSSTPVELLQSTSSPACLRSFIKKSMELSHLPHTSPHLFANRTAFAPDKRVPPGEHDHGAFAGELTMVSSKRAEGFSEGLPLKSLSCDGVCKQDTELDRRSVIFSSGVSDHLGAPAHSYADGKSLEQDTPKGLWTGSTQSLPCSQTYSSNGPQEPSLPCRPRPKSSCPVPIKVCPRSPPSETRTRTSSSCSSYSYAEDGSGGSPSSLPQFEFSTSPCSNMARCLAMEHQEHGMVGDAILTQMRPKIKCEKSYDTNSSDESGSFSEGDSESCHIKEDGPEVKLPFPVNQITDLPRNDFQLMIKMHKLTSEQMEFIHDIRRRTKNRIAAQRCRKRKLDCIQNLECEIRKLVCEKQKLLTERNQLKACMGELWENLSFLSQEVCREEQLNPDQVQSLYRHCPVSPSSTTSIDLTVGTDSPVPEGSFTRSPAAKQEQCTGAEGGTDLRQDPGSSLEVGPALDLCSQTVTVDFCQEMTDKCTTDEQPMKDCTQ